MTDLKTSLENFWLRELRSLRLELEAFPDPKLIWALPAGLPNSAGPLTLHLVGNLQSHIGAIFGGSGYVRDRDRQFRARDVSREELLELITATEAAIRATLPRLTAAQLAAPFPQPIRGQQLETAELLIQLAVHLAYHLGQVSYHRRLVTGDATGVGALAADELSTAR